MQRSAIAVSFEDKNAGTFGVGGVVLEHFCPGDSTDDVANPDPVVRKFVMPVLRNNKLSSCNKVEDSLPRPAHAGKCMPDASDPQLLERGISNALTSPHLGRNMSSSCGLILPSRRLGGTRAPELPEEIVACQQKRKEPHGPASIRRL